MLGKISKSVGLSALLLSAGLAYGADAPKIDEKSNEVLKAVSTHMASLKSFTYTAHAMTDLISSSNEKVTYDSDINVSLKRPNKLLAKKSGYVAINFLFNGNMIVGFNPKSLTYASADESGDLDSLAKILSKYQIEAPMLDFISSDAYSVLTADVESGTYIGLAEIAGVKCHHLALRQNNVDWQLWVDAGAAPLLKRFQVTSKGLTGSPSYTVDINAWVSNPELADSLFEFTAPTTASKVEFKDLKAE